ncbi:MAG: hypothetical protein A2622_11030 [Bdellovibrionales bacterium RIFCSPHIGHO2_01_FULL_40_29]|nr:MAG: hypothetical protein A2622_11030 [Bdellovibrionales bacterium RIFCSPHIGHO2_01_FULL_40_29]OFZ34487.1 MAG: hypothetical protein A3D17_01295 [Bdellovibrionales bacterium RIFCSPHIGHO2_02_FULL_40_15]
MKNYLKEKINSGKPTFGIWNIIPSATVVEIIAAAGFDFQIFDLEHGLFDFESLENAIRTSETAGCSALVRIGELNSVSSQRALDMGAHGLIFPQIQNASDSERAVHLCNYPPNGCRGYNPFTRANAFGFQDQAAVKRNTSDFALTSVIIENLSAQKNLDEILKTENLDIVYLGAYDMSVALGKPGDMENPELVDFLESSVKKIRDNGKAAGVMARSSAEVSQYSKLGANLLVVGVDSFLIGNGMKNVLKELSSSVQR